MGSPAFTEEASALLAMAMEAHSTVTEAEDELSPRLPEASLVELAEAVLRMVVQLWAVVGGVTWTWTEAPARRMSGHLTTMEAEDDPEPALMVAKVAVLSTSPHVAAVVGEMIWTWTLAPAASSAGP